MLDEPFWAERHRDYLRLLGLAQLSPGAQAKIDLSGVILSTMLEAHQARPLDDPIEQSASRLKTYLLAAESSPSTKAIRSETADLLLQAVSRLPDDQQTAVELHHLQGLPLQEIATRMQRPKGAVAALIYRGMKKLRATLDEAEL